MKYVILLYGLSGSGKSTSAKYLCEEHGYHRMSFAAPIKKMVTVLGASQESLYGGSEYRDESLGIIDRRKGGSGVELTVRGALQSLGTDWGRSLNENIWTAIAIKEIHEDPRHTHVVFDDARFMNERDALREDKNIRVISVLLLRGDRDEDADVHESELVAFKARIHEFGVVIDNRYEHYSIGLLHAALAGVTDMF